MNYHAHYQMLVLRAKMRKLSGYVERHHIVPKCLGGTNDKDNIVPLTAREHYVAHQLLVKMYPTTRGLVAAALRMARQCIGSRAYEWLRRRQAEHSRLSMLGNTYAVIRSEAHRAKLSAAHIGIKQSPESIAKRAALMRGRVLSGETKAKIGAKNKGRYVGIKRPPRSPEHQAKLTAYRLGMKLPPEWGAKISQALTGRKLSAEHRANIAASRVGRKMPPEAVAKTAAARRGMKHTAEARAKMSAALKGRKRGPYSPEHRAKISATHRARHAAA